MPATIGDILKTKPELITITPEATLYDALELVNHHPPKGGGFALALPTSRHPSSTARLRVPCRANPAAIAYAEAYDREPFTWRRFPRQNSIGSVGNVRETVSADVSASCLLHDRDEPLHVLLYHSPAPLEAARRRTPTRDRGSKRLIPPARKRTGFLRLFL